MTLSTQKTKLKEIKKLKKELYDLSHAYIRKRDSIDGEDKTGYCCCCKKYSTGQQFQCGHYIPDAAGGALLRYHPWNMNGQCGGCNCDYNQELSKTRYARFMYEKYGTKKVEKLHFMHNQAKSIQADRYFYESMIELYKQGDELEIVKFLGAYL